MTRYAEGTEVPVERTREALYKLLRENKSTEVAFAGGSDGRARVAFKIDGCLYAVEVPRIDRSKLRVPAGPFSQLETRRANVVAAEERRLWRCLLLIVKAKLEAARNGISTIQDEFMARIVMADGRLLGDALRPRLDELAKSGHVPSLLPSGQE